MFNTSSLKEIKMENSNELLIGMAVLVVITCVAAVVIFKWQKQRRVHQVETWVRKYLYNRYGRLPDHLHINCSDDLLWPVLVNFHAPRTGVLHSLEFACGGPQPTWVRRSEREHHD